MADVVTDTIDDPYGAPIETDPAEIEAEFHDGMREKWPDWEPVPTSALTHLIGVLAQVSAESRATFVAMLRTIVLELLGSMFGVPRLDGTPARSTITVTASDTLGHELADRATVYVGDVECETGGPLVIPTGQTRGTITIVAVEPGTAANGAAAGVQIDAVDWLAETDGVVLDDPLDLGTDGEDDTAYSIRLAEELQTLTRAPILPANYATAARRHPLVGHVWVIPNYNPDTRSFGEENAVTIVVTDLLGEPVDTDVLDEVSAALEAEREVNAGIWVVTPAAVRIDASVSFIAQQGFDAATVAASVRSRLQQVLSPAPWITPPYGLDPSYVPTRVVHKYELVAQADQVTGVDYVTDVRVGDGSADSITLGVLELPAAGTVTVTGRSPEV